MTVPDRSDLSSGYKTTMDDMRQELSPLERTWSRVIHSAIGRVVGVIVGSILLRPRSLLIGASLAIIMIIGMYVAAWLYDTPYNNTEPLLAFIFGWVVGLLYDLFFVATRRHSR